MTPTRPIQVLFALAAVAAISVVAGCGSDSSGETNTQAQVSVPTVTSPLSTTAPSTSSAPSAGTTTRQKTSKTTTSSGGSAPPCTVPDAYQDFRYGGLDCSSAVAVARAWDENGKRCNTVDNPESPIGPQRTCTVNGYSCTAKRDIHSDSRFVTCTQGGSSVRFTWLPA
jgi:hypothetical protein